MIYYLCVIVFSVLIHEFGHLLSALYFNVKVKAFSLGFGTVILHKKWKNIDWRLSLLPFGGYCDIEESITDKNSLSNIVYWKQVIILMAGVFLNFMLAVICYLIQYKSIIKGLYIDFMLLKPMIVKDYYYVALLDRDGDNGLDALIQNNIASSIDFPFNKSDPRIVCIECKNQEDMKNQYKTAKILLKKNGKDMGSVLRSCYNIENRVVTQLSLSATENGSNGK